MAARIRVRRSALDRDQRHIWRRRAVTEVRAGNLPGKVILTAEALLACLGSEGELYPSQAALVARAGIGVRTVGRHVERMAELGLIRKHRRLVMMPWPQGGHGARRAQQTSNAYELLFPREHVMLRFVLQPAPTLRARPIGQRHDYDGHNGAEEADRKIPLPSDMDRAAALAALEAVQVARESALAARWWKARNGH